MNSTGKSNWPHLPVRLFYIGRQLERLEALSNCKDKAYRSAQSEEVVDRCTRPIASKIPYKISNRISAEFKPNEFIANPGDKPITTDSAPHKVFEELAHLGEGSSGTIVKMRHKPTGKICAVKQMTRTINEDHSKRIYMDLKSLLDCDCPNIVQCCGYFVQPTEVWICMEMMSSCLEKLLIKRDRRPLPEKFVGSVAASAVKALHYLEEELNIVHRDVKPSNILINQEGEIKVCDFGISCRLGDSLADSRLGCIPYMAPERLKPNSGACDARADVWSLGITLFELATGDSPYANLKGTFSKLTVIVNEEPPRLPDDMIFSDEFRDFISACLTHDYELRPGFDELIEHKFITTHMDSIVRLSELDGDIK